VNELDIFSNALKIASADERSQYHDQPCGDDVELRQRLDDLLRSHSDVRSFMVALAPGIGANIDEPICEKPSTATGSERDDRTQSSKPNNCWRRKGNSIKGVEPKVPVCKASGNRLPRKRDINNCDRHFFESHDPPCDNNANVRMTGVISF